MGPLHKAFAPQADQSTSLRKCEAVLRTAECISRNPGSRPRLDPATCSRIIPFRNNRHNSIRNQQGKMSPRRQSHTPVSALWIRTCRRRTIESCRNLPWKVDSPRDHRDDRSTSHSHPTRASRLYRSLHRSLPRRGIQLRNRPRARTRQLYNVMCRVRLYKRALQSRKEMIDLQHGYPLHHHR
jgi:hypothetical protein